MKRWNWGVKWLRGGRGIELGSKTQVKNLNWGVKWLPGQGWGGVIELGNKNSSIKMAFGSKMAWGEDGN